MDVRIDQNGPFTVATLVGELGLTNSDRVGIRLGELIASPESRLAIDLAQVRQINSTGLSILINVVTRGRLNGSRVVLVAPSSFVCGVLEVTQLDQWFEIVEDLDAAARIFGADGTSPEARK